MPRVSVVIPLYNKAEHLPKTLASVFAQTCDDYEVLVIDDGSTDGGPAWVESQEDPRVRLIRQPNAGPGAARNHGIREAAGEWIAPLDADDAWEPTFLAHTLEKADAHPECDVVVSFWFTDPQTPNAMRDRFAKFGVPTGPYRLEQGLKPTPMRRLAARFGCRNTLMRKSAALANGGFYEKQRHGEDMYLWLQLLLNCKLYLAEAPLGFWNTEASELSAGARREGRHPMPRPIVSEPDPIRANCPEAYREQLERLLHALARREAWHQILAGRPDTAKDVLWRFPDVCHNLYDRMRFAVWLRLARGQGDKPVTQWRGVGRALYRYAKFMRIKSGSL